MNLNIKRIQKVISPKETAVFSNFFSLIDCQTLGETLTRHHQKSAAQSSCQVDGSEIRRGHHHLGCKQKTLQIMGYLPYQLVNARFLLSTVSMIMVGKKSCRASGISSCALFLTKSLFRPSDLREE